MLFNNTRHKITDLNICIDGSTVSLSESVKYLGLLIDPHLTWKSHIDFLCNKLSKIII